MKRAANAAILLVMIRALVGLIALLAVTLPAVDAQAQITEFCPFLEARIFADDGQILGRITPDTNAIDSLVNPFGDHGSEFSPISIFNLIGAYGGMFSLQSPYNPTTFFPPRIVVDGQPVARLTINPDFSPRVLPDSLVSWLRTDAPGRCGEPTPTATMIADAPTATAVTTAPTQTAVPTATLPRTPGITPPSTLTPGFTLPPTRTAPPDGTRTPLPVQTIVPPLQRTQLNRRGSHMCAIVEPHSTSTCAPLLLGGIAIRLLRRPRQRRGDRPCSTGDSARPS